MRHIQSASQINNQSLSSPALGYRLIEREDTIVERDHHRLQPTVVKMVNISRNGPSTASVDPPQTDRRPNSAKRLRPGISPWNDELAPRYNGTASTATLFPPAQ